MQIEKFNSVMQKVNSACVQEMILMKCLITVMFYATEQ